MNRIFLHGKSYVSKLEKKGTCSKDFLICSALENNNSELNRIEKSVEMLITFFSIALPAIVINI